MDNTPVYAYLVALAAAMGGFLIGYEMGMIGQLIGMPSFNVQFGIQRDQKLNLTLPDGVVVHQTYKQIVLLLTHNKTFSENLYDAGFDFTAISLPDTRLAPEITGYIAFSFLAGAIAGAAIVAKLADGLGRRYSIFMGSVLFMVGGAMQAGAVNLSMLLVGRVVAGLGVGVMSAVVPLYISETAKTAIRGRLITVFQLMMAFGILIKCAVNSVLLTFITGNLQWRLALGLPLIPCLIMWLLIIVLPFSPRWLIDRNRDDEAVHTLAKLRNKPADCEELLAEFATIKENVNYEMEVGHATWLEILQPGIRNRVALGIILQFFQQWSGCNVMLYYGGKVFSAIGMPVIHAFVTLIVLNAAINFLSTFFALWWVDRIGRKVLMIVGGFAMCFCHAAIACCLGLSDRVDEQYAEYFVRCAVVFIYLYTIIFASTLGPIVWVYQSEIFPMRVRAKAASLCTMSNWIWNAVVAKLAPIMLAYMAYYTNVVFSSFCFACGIFVWAFVPETKGLTLECMNEIFGTPPDEARSPDDKREKKIQKIMMLEADKLKQEQLDMSHLRV
ncbi:uncharacterized protein LOC129593350 [Paramacrobiotus metropolitanus]|uniref:uncharacterized protein LOC129593350 n=1 Tax=Paramacrobiotus metropolitanus TaxID=2943436 RepID=UPI002445908B|nr:uncharacterized protein LOC129593350 [Paramacrobiotus metropolitanus]XP_055345585.1 uncharacterized protein LOC129593350 [Paramacrobiotus metropolitanus]XP_055345586.1 uncharacterized protein LOC129593350 [Paramacrobiotus metropolitanus]